MYVVLFMCVYARVYVCVHIDVYVCILVYASVGMCLFLDMSVYTHLFFNVFSLHTILRVTSDGQLHSLGYRLQMVRALPREFSLRLVGAIFERSLLFTSMMFYLAPRLLAVTCQMSVRCRLFSSTAFAGVLH